MKNTRPSRPEPITPQISRAKNQLSRVTPMLHSRQYLKTKPGMSTNPTGSGHDNDVVRNSSLYREFQAERDEILRHKWIESEIPYSNIRLE